MMNPVVASSGLAPVAMGAHDGVDAAGVTNIGLSRAGNEDAFLIATLERSMTIHAASPAANNARFCDGFAAKLLIVADGMGGEGGGDIASRVAINTVASYLLNVMPWAAPTPPSAPDGPSSGVQAQLSSALVIGDSSVKVAAAHSETPHMGTTLTMALVLWPALYVAHAGDTRCYLLRKGQLSRLTKDHTMAQKLIDEAVEPVEPDSQLHHVLWNSLGGSASLPEPQIVKLALEPDDRILLCSDGLTKHVSDPEILSALATSEPNAGKCEKLVQLAIVGGGSDNVTVVIATLNAPSASAGILMGGAPFTATA